MIEEINKEKLNFTENMFIRELSNPFIRGFDNNETEIIGNSCGYSMRMSLVASIGEFVERKYLYKFFSEISEGKNKQGISLIDGKIYDYKDMMKEDYLLYFLDSCGTACHTSSINAINKAFAEYVERQAFIYRYLSKTKKNCLLHDKEFDTIIPKEFHGLEFYDISLTDNYYVILAIGEINENVVMGLGSDFSINKAILQAVKELFQMNEYYKKENLINKHCDKDIEKNLKEDNKKNDYFDLFTKLSSEKIMKAYSFLENSSIKAIKDYSVIQVNLDEVIKTLNKEWNFKPILYYLETNTREKATKIVKIIDFGWFPNLAPGSYSEAIYQNIEEITKHKLDRNCNFIPFP